MKKKKNEQQKRETTVQGYAFLIAFIIPQSLCLIAAIAWMSSGGMGLVLGLALMFVLFAFMIS